jgi:hypothetical protein
VRASVLAADALPDAASFAWQGGGRLELRSAVEPVGKRRLSCAFRAYGFVRRRMLWLCNITEEKSASKTGAIQSRVSTLHN